VKSQNPDLGFNVLVLLVLFIITFNGRKSEVELDRVQMEQFCVNHFSVRSLGDGTLQWFSARKSINNSFSE
jgi:hypothetical protein